METDFNTKQLKTNFEAYLQHIVLKNINLILSIGILLLIYYLYSDYSVRDDMRTAATRLLPLVFSILLLITHLYDKHNYYKLKHIVYVLLYISLQLMQYSNCLIHIDNNNLSPNITGANLIIFIISLDIKLNTKTTLLIYTLPLLIFTIALIFFIQPSSDKLFIIADIYPIVVIGFIANRLQYKLRFKLFKSNQLLELEKEKTKRLYSETLTINDKLKKKAKEAIIIKEEIQKKNTELNISNATKDKFLAVIAHDLKNPIGVIWGLSDILISDPMMDHKKRMECLKTINNCTESTHKLLENLLNWAMAQDKSISINPSLTNANKTTEDELKVLRQIADKKSINIENRISKDIKIYVDLNMFRSIIRNLVSNATKYTYANGQIIINARPIKLEDKQFIEIAIIDNGIGMSPGIQSQLFNITRNTSTPGTENETGTGLGLLLCKEFIELHNGSISVRSQIGKGSVFTFILPCTPY